MELQCSKKRLWRIRTQGVARKSKGIKTVQGERRECVSASHKRALKATPFRARICLHCHYSPLQALLWGAKFCALNVGGSRTVMPCLTHHAIPKRTTTKQFTGFFSPQIDTPHRRTLILRPNEAI